VYAGVMAIDLLVPARSLKQKRSVVRPLIAHLRREFSVAAAEAGHLDLVGRTQLGVSVVSSEMAHCRDVLDTCQRWVEAEPHLEFLDARRTYVSDEEL
jgi:uncharacterized protein YlxP (DUF503 family)